jgi:uncharacterized membrane protein
MAKICPNCQFSNDDNSTKCSVCGQDLSSDFPVNNNTNKSNAGAIWGLKLLRNGYSIFILEFILGIALSFILIRSFSIDAFLGPIGTVSSASTISTVSSITTYIIVILVVEAIISIIGYVLIYRGLGVLSNLKSNIKTGSTGALLVIVGFLLIVVFAILVLAVAPSFITSTTSSSSFLTSHVTKELVYGVILLVVGAILLFIGIIMLTIGVFRVGSAFSSGSVEAGAILAIFLSIVGYIILVVGLNGIIKRYRNANDS